MDLLTKNLLCEIEQDNIFQVIHPTECIHNIFCITQENSRRGIGDYSRLKGEYISQMIKWQSHFTIRILLMQWTASMVDLRGTKSGSDYSPYWQT